MKVFLQQAGYVLEPLSNIWSRSGYGGIAYSDGDEAEQRIASIISHASDVTVLSTELRQHCTDWASLYHLSGTRANILRPFKNDFQGDVLEIGAGCGAITRYLGECGANVLALEGSRRRAAIARSRTRDLDNVTVLADKFDQFQCDHQFDIITLIGVLEYANLFTAGENPALSMLERVRSLLKPEGKLIIAIENQLGLKYFAGAPEDHVGQPMYGIEGRYRKDQPQTYGRMELTEILRQAGYANSEFMAAFPDYKLPTSIVTENGFSNEGFDSSALASQSVKRDPQLPPLLVFSPELVWPTLVQNKIALDLANSFLIVAGGFVEQVSHSRILAWHFTTERSKELCKETRFVRTGNASIEVQYYLLAPGSPKQIDERLLMFSVPKKAEYVRGQVLAKHLLNIVTRDGWRTEEVGVFFKKYLHFLGSAASICNFPLRINSADIQLPGRFFDFIPQNIIVRSDGTWQVIDEEWVFNGNLTVGQLVFRSLLSLFNSVTRFGATDSDFSATPLGFIQAIFRAIGFSVLEDEIDKYAKLEMKLEAEVVQRPVASDQFLNWLHTARLPGHNLVLAMAARDGQIADLTQAVAARDGQIADLTQAVVARDGQIADHTQAVAARDGQIEALIKSRSWQITKPLRFVGRLVRGQYTNVLAPLKIRTSKGFASIPWRAHSGMSYVMKDGRKGFSDRILARAKHSALVAAGPPTATTPKRENWGILTTQYTYYIAQLIADKLKGHGWHVDIFDTVPEYFNHDWYIVLCPHMFDRLPQAEKRIIFQLEQSVRSRWFTDEYFEILNKSLAVLEYALTNVEYLALNGIKFPRVHYLPIGSSWTYGETVPEQSKTCDVLFYGEYNSSPRRREMLDALRVHFKVRIVSDVFGEEIIGTIKQARVVINLHYYENALLEMPRIQECLALGVPVVSESTHDQEEYPEIQGAVWFFDEGSIPAMLSAVRRALDNPIPNKRIYESVSKGAQRFDSMFDQFLAAMGFLSDPGNHPGKLGTR